MSFNLKKPMSIIPGDTVKYIDSENIVIDKHPKTIRVAKYGIWDGEKVVLDDKEHTTVYKLDWLTKVYFNKGKLQEICDHFKIEYTGTPHQVFIEIPSIIARNRPFPKYLFPLNHSQHIVFRILDAYRKDDRTPEDVLYDIVFPKKKNEIHNQE